MAEDNFVQCAGYHHGTYVSFQFVSQDTMHMVLTNDGEAPEELVLVSNGTKGSEKMTLENYEATIREAVNASNNGTDAGMGNNLVLVQGSNENTTVYVNLNGRNSDNFLVANGYVEPLTCEIIQ